MKYINPWGNTPKERNRFQEYYLEIIKAIDNEDWLYVRQLSKELELEQWVNLQHKLASYTRRKMADGLSQMDKERGD